MVWLYYLGLSIALAVAGPILLLTTKKARFGVSEKLGFVPERIPAKTTRPRIWFHTVSVGEFNATRSLIELFHERHPEFEVFVSTTTGTGQELARSKVGSWATVFYFPFDLPFATGAWLDRVQPDVVAIAETEIWPGFVQSCAQRGIKLCCVNGRISPRSFKRYKSLSFIIKPTLARLSLIAAQSDQEAQRYRSLGGRTDAVVACGNMKFDGVKSATTQQREELQQRLNIRNDDVVIVAGSTHEGEESALLEAVKSLNHAVRLVIAPRHPERFDRVCQIVESYGFRARRFTRNEAFEAANDVYVLDTIGQLLSFYSLSTIAFVGGTIAPIGGHNIAEPCIYEVPVVCGPRIEKTRDVFRSLLERKGIVQVQSAAELLPAFERLIAFPQLRSEIGQAGKTFLDDSQGAVERTLAELENLLPQPTVSHSGACCSAPKQKQESAV